MVVNIIQEKIVEVLKEVSTIQVDLLAVKSGLSISALNVELFNLELEGVVRALPGSKYSLI